MTGTNVARIQPVPLRAVVDVASKEAAPPRSERARTIEAYVDRLMRRSPALDRGRIKENVEWDLKYLAEHSLSSSDLLLRYKWTVINGRFQVDWKDSNFPA